MPLSDFFKKTQRQKRVENQQNNNQMFIGTLMETGASKSKQTNLIGTKIHYLDNDALFYTSTKVGKITEKHNLSDVSLELEGNINTLNQRINRNDFILAYTGFFCTLLIGVLQAAKTVYVDEKSNLRQPIEFTLIIVPLILTGFISGIAKYSREKAIEAKNEITESADIVDNYLIKNPRIDKRDEDNEESIGRYSGDFQTNRYGNVNNRFK